MSINAHDINAEMAMLGAALSGAEGPLLVMAKIPLDAWYSERHRRIALHVQELTARQQDIDPSVVLSTLQESGDLQQCGGGEYLHTLYAHAWAAGNAQYYAERIRELYGRRMLWEAHKRETQRLDALQESDRYGEDRTDVEASIRRMETVFEEARKMAAGSVQVEPMNAEEFMGQSDTFDWLVPGLLERHDRVVLTGEEGLGKTELVTQFAMTLAAGVHPWTGEPLGDGTKGIRVLIIDCENSRGQLRRRFKRIAVAIEGMRARRSLDPPDWKQHLMVEFRGAGMDLTSSMDLAWLESLVAAAAPDLLVVGPLYKMAEDENDAQAAKAVTSVLDRIRMRHQCALITEAHAGHADDGKGSRRMRPRGSSVYLGWPEFGFGLRKDKEDPSRIEMVSWRGQREERDWPEAIRRSSYGLPWQPEGDYYRPDPGFDPRTEPKHEPPAPPPEPQQSMF